MNQLLRYGISRAWVGVAAAMLLGAWPARGEPKSPTAKAPTLRLCTGTPGNNYDKAGRAIAKALKGRVAVEVIETKGTWENLKFIDGSPRRCDAIIGQEDAYTLYHFGKPDSVASIERVTGLYSEYIHLLCNQATEIETVFDLKPGVHRVLVDEYGSGSYVTWTLFGKMNPMFGRIQARSTSHEEAVADIVGGTAAQCMLFVSGLKAGTLMAAHDRHGEQLRLVDISDPMLRKPVGGDHRVVYRQSTIDRSVYPKLLDHDLDTPAVEAAFFIHPEWRASHADAFTQLVAALQRLTPALRKL